jgi:hypothetical protein
VPRRRARCSPTPGQPCSSSSPRGAAATRGGRPTPRRSRSSTVSHLLAFLACIGSPCLRRCVHGASIGGKGSLQLDLGAAEGRATAARLLGAAAVFVTNLECGELQELGMHPDVLRRQYPGLVVAVVSAWGLGHPSGPSGEKGAFFACACLVADSQSCCLHTRGAVWTSNRAAAVRSRAANASAVGARWRHRQLHAAARQPAAGAGARTRSRAPRRAAQPSPAPPAPWLGLCGVAACGASRGDTPRPAAAESRFGCDLLTYVHAARRRVQPEQLGEVLCSFFLLASVTAAVFHRERTGEGQLVDLAQLRCACWLTNQVCRRRHQWPADGSRVASARVIE